MKRFCSTVGLVLLAASLASLLGAGFGFAKANHSGARLEAVLTATSVVTLASSWAVVCALQPPGAAVDPPSSTPAATNRFGSPVGGGSE